MCLKNHNNLVGLQQRSGKRALRKCFGGSIAWLQRSNSFSISAFSILTFSSGTLSYPKIKTLLLIRVSTKSLTSTMPLRCTEIKKRFISVYTNTPKTWLPILSRETFSGVSTSVFSLCLEIFNRKIQLCTKKSLN